MTVRRDLAALLRSSFLGSRTAVARLRCATLGFVAALTLVGCASETPTRAERLDSMSRVEPMHVVRDGVVHCRTDDVLELCSAIVTLPPDFPDALTHIDANLGVAEGCQPNVVGVYLRTDDMHVVSHRDATWLQSHDHRLDVTMGCAVAISDDGYFLTAAHCVDQTSNVFLVCQTGHDEFEITPFRVVWSGGGAPDGVSFEEALTHPDIAIIHAELRPAHVARVAERAELAIGASIIGGRFVTTSDVHRERWPMYAGAIEEITPKVGDAGAFALRLSAPSCGGDSGGPVLLEDGSIAAVVSASFTQWFGQRGTLAWTMPNTSIERIVSADRAEQMRRRDREE